MLLAVLSSFVSAAFATTLVVLPLDPRGLDAESGELATDTLRDALTADGNFDVPRGTALASAMTAGHEADLRQAREQLGAGKSAIAKGDLKGGVTALERCVSLHLDAASVTVRRGELADTLWLLAETRLRLGDSLQARDDLTGVAHLWPGYAKSRSRSGTGTAGRMLAEIEGGVAREAWKVDTDAVDAAFRAANPDWVLAGSIDATGAVSLHVLGPDGDDTVVNGTVPLPVDPVAAEWTTLADRVARAATGGGAAASSTPTRAAEDESVSGLQPDPDDTEGADPDGVAPRRAPEPNERPAARKEKPVTIREVRPMEDPNRPITTRWWFWTALAGVVGGGTAIGVVLAEPAPVITIREAPHYSVSVAPD